MTNHSYDEDLSENDFFITIQNYEDGEIFRKVVNEGWLICVPKKAALSKYLKIPIQETKMKRKTSHVSVQYSQNLILRHILIPNDDFPESRFTSLDDNEFQITGNSIDFINEQKGNRR